MALEALSKKTPSEICADLGGFAQRYVRDWDQWLAAEFAARPHLLGVTLRRWQATRPRAMRRLQSEARHPAPCLDDLVAVARPHLATLQVLELVWIRNRGALEDSALVKLWKIFETLPISGTASRVGITKAIRLLTEGRVGPALDSQVRKHLSIKPAATAAAWIALLELVADDIAGFESRHGPLSQVVPPRFRAISYGRLYDMVRGPR